jgi:H+-transporting ATPase
LGLYQYSEHIWRMDWYCLGLGTYRRTSVLRTGLTNVLLQNIIWFIPLDLVKFAMKATVIKALRARHEKAAKAAAATHGVPIIRTQSRAASIHESLYSNRVSFIKRAARKVGFGQKISMKPEELQRFSSIQAQRVGATLARNPSRTATA